MAKRGRCTNKLMTRYSIFVFTAKQTHQLLWKLLLDFLIMMYEKLEYSKQGDSIYK